MTFDARTPDVRAMVSAVAVGGLAGLAVGAAYLAGSLAHAALFHAQAASDPIATLHRPAIHLTLPQPRLALASIADAGPGLGGALRDPFRLSFAMRLRPAQPFQSNASAHGREAECLAQAVYYEARGESDPGQQAVAQVVLNRVRHPSFPKTICAVVFQRAGGGCQFSFACNGAMHDAVEPTAWRRAIKVAQRAIGGAVMAEVGDATQFQAARSGGWAGGLFRVAQVGAHVFYRLVGRGGAPAASRTRPALPAGPMQFATASPEAHMATEPTVLTGAPPQSVGAGEPARPALIVAPAVRVSTVLAAPTLAPVIARGAAPSFVAGVSKPGDKMSDAPAVKPLTVATAEP